MLCYYKKTYKALLPYGLSEERADPPKSYFIFRIKNVTKTSLEVK